MVRKQLTKKQKDNIQKFVLYPLVGLISLLIFYLLFCPSQAIDEVSHQGFNTEITAGQTINIDDDKTKVYKQEILNQKQRERKYIKDLGYLLSGQDSLSEENRSSDDLYLDSSGNNTSPSSTVAKAEKSIRSSTNAYRDINKNLGSFYETSQKDDENEQLKKRIQELEEQQAEQALQLPQDPTVDDQLAILEKSYELAAKYSNPNMNGSKSSPTKSMTNSSQNNRSTQIADIKQVKHQVVSSLSQPMTDKEFDNRYKGYNNSSFNTAVGQKVQRGKNTIAACIHNDQTITDGKTVRIRLLEPMIAGSDIVNKGSVLSGVAKVQGERLYINISSIEYKGSIIPVELLVADSDGQEGIYIPNSMELNAVKEVAANLGNNLGTTINLTSQSAGDVLLSELGKGAIQGASQYINKKLREVKVHLKSGYLLMLYQKQ